MKLEDLIEKDLTEIIDITMYEFEKLEKAGIEIKEENINTLASLAKSKAVLYGFIFKNQWIDNKGRVDLDYLENIYEILADIDWLKNYQDWKDLRKASD